MDLETIENYLKIDGNDDDLYVQDLLTNSQIYIDSMVGEDYKTDDKAVKLATLLQQKLIADMYDNRGTEIPTTTKTDRIVNSILDKLSGFEVIV